MPPLDHRPMAERRHETRLKSIYYIIRMTNSTRYLLQMFDINQRRFTVGYQSPIMGLRSGLQGTKARDTLHIAAEVSPRWRRR